MVRSNSMKKDKRFSKVMYTIKDEGELLQFGSDCIAFPLFPTIKAAKEYLYTTYAEGYTYDIDDTPIWPDIVPVHVIQLENEEIPLRRKITVLPTDERFRSRPFDTRRIQLDYRRGKRSVRK